MSRGFGKNEQKILWVLRDNELHHVQDIIHQIYFDEELTESKKQSIYQSIRRLEQKKYIVSIMSRLPYSKDVIGSSKSKLITRNPEAIKELLEKLRLFSSSF